MNKVFFCSIALWLASAVVPATAAGGGSGATAVYNQFCSHCHGIGMVNAGTASYDLRKFPRDDKARFVDSVMNGRGKMPPWGDILTSDEVELLWQYVATRAGKEPMPEDDSTSGSLESDTLPVTLEAGTLSVCLAENGGVWSSPENGGAGFEYLLSAQMAKTLELDFKPVWYDSDQEEENTPARDQNALLSQGVCDLVAGVSLYATNLQDRSGDRAAPPRWSGRPRHLGREYQVDLQAIAVTAPYARVEMAVVLQRALADRTINKLSDLDGLKLGIEQGTLSGALSLNQGTAQMRADSITFNPGPGFLEHMERGAFDAALISVTDFDRHRERTSNSNLQLSDYRHRIGLNVAYAALASNDALVQSVSKIIQDNLANESLKPLAKASHLTFTPPAKPWVQAAFTTRDLFTSE